MTEQNGITRRGVLGRLALLVGGAAAGAGVAVKAVPQAPPPATPAVGPGTQKLVLRIGDLRSYIPAVEPGKLPKGQWTSLPTGTTPYWRLTSLSITVGATNSPAPACPNVVSSALSSSSATMRGRRPC